MAAPASATTFTDEELKALKPDEIDVLTDEEVARLYKLTSAAPEPAERKTTEAKRISGSNYPIEQPPQDINNLVRSASMGLVGKPSLSEFEAKKAQPPQTYLGLPEYGTRVGAEAPPLPPREATGFMDFGKMLGDAAASGQQAKTPEPEPNPAYAGDAVMENPEALASRIQQQQSATISGGQSSEVLSGNVPMVNQQTQASVLSALPRMVPHIIESQIASLSEFAFHPIRQMTESPMEFGGNLAIAASGLAALGKIGSATKEAATLSDAIKAAPEKAVSAYISSIDGKMDDAAMLKEQIQVLGGDEETLQRVREVERRFQKIKEVVADVRGPSTPPAPEPPRFQVGDVVTHRSGKTYKVVRPSVGRYVEVADESGKVEKFHPDWLTKWDGRATPPLPTSGVSAGAQSKVHLTDALSASPAGVMLLAGSQKEDVEEPGAKRSSSPLSLKSALFSGILGFGFYRFIKDPEFRQALLEFTQVSKKNPPDLEKVFEKLFVPLLPDVPANGLGQWINDPIKGMPTWVTPPVAAGGIAGAALGSRAGRDEIDPKMAAFGAIGGMIAGAMVGTAFGRSFQTSLTYRQLYRMWFTEGAGMSESALGAKRATMMALDGRIAEIKDTAEMVSKFDSETQAMMHEWLAGNVSLHMVPEAARWPAAKTRLIFDELSLDLLSSGLVRDKILKKTITTNLGTYLPRLFLRYELGEKAHDIVDAWLTSQGKGWGWFSSRDYLKGKKDLPPTVLKALGEIVDRPGYLLGKRGVMTATDVEVARYNRFILSSPENSIPAKTVRLQQKIDRVQRSLREGGEEFAKPGLIRAAKGNVLTAPQEVVFTKEKGGLDAALWNGTTYWKMPSNPRYGLLANRYVERAVAEDIMGMHETSSGLGAVFQKGVSIFKFNKAVYNPASQIRNIASNAIFADILAGVSPWRIDKWARSGKELMTSGKIYQAARRDGTFGGGFAPSEIEAMLYPDLESSSGIMAFAGKATHTAFDKAPISPAFYARWHQSSEAHARLTVYIQGIEKMGMTGPEAAAFARKVIPDYRDVPRWLRVYRNSAFGAPFLSFSYKAIPRMFESAFAFGNPKQFLRFWKYPFAMAAINEHNAYTMGHLGQSEGKGLSDVTWRMLVRTFSLGIGTPDSYDTYRKFLPSHAGEMQLLLKHRDAYDRPRYYDTTYAMPWGDLGEGGKGPIGATLGGDWFPRQMEPANPWLQVATALTTGKDNFTGKDVIGPGEQPMAAWAAYMARTFGPAVMFNPEGFGAQNIYKAFSQGPVADPYVKTRTDALVSELAAGRTRPVDPQEVLLVKERQFLSEIRDLKGQIVRMGRIALRDPDEEISQSTIEELRANHPDKQLSRALREYEQKMKDFKEKYLSEPVPPTPEKLTRAIQAFQERGKK